MNSLLALQNLALELSPGLLPLFAIIYSFVNSWHCMAMCGPLLAGHDKKSLDRFFITRVISYTACGAIFGAAGKLLRDSLEVSLLNALGFFILAVTSIYIVLVYLMPVLRKRTNSRFRWLPASIQGLLFPLVPCHLLGFYYGIATLSGSAAAGALLLFIHAIATTPALAYTQKAKRWLNTRVLYFGLIVRLALMALVFVNLAYFAGRVLDPTSNVREKPLFCF